MSQDPETSPLPPIEALLAHRPPLLLLDAVRSASAAELQADVCVVRAHPFATDDGVPGLLAIEYLAQAVAAHQGVADLHAGRAVTEGFLLGTRSFTVHRPWLALGTRLVAHVEREFMIGGELGRYHARLVDAADGTCVAEGDLKVFQSPEHVRTLKGRSN